MPTPAHPNQSELGAGIEGRKEFDALVERIRGFAFENADADDLARMARATKLIAEHTVATYENVKKMERELQVKLKIAAVAEAVQGVVSVHKSAPSIFGRFRKAA